MGLQRIELSRKFIPGLYDGRLDIEVRHPGAKLRLLQSHARILLSELTHHVDAFNVDAIIGPDGIIHGDPPQLIGVSWNIEKRMFEWSHPDIYTPFWYASPNQRTQDDIRNTWGHASPRDKQHLERQLIDELVSASVVEGGIAIATYRLEPYRDTFAFAIDATMEIDFPNASQPSTSVEGRGPSHVVLYNRTGIQTG